MEKDLVVIAGRNEEAVGKPLIYATSKSFMDYFGINSPEELPKISEVIMEEFEKATVVSNIIVNANTQMDDAVATDDELPQTAENPALENDGEKEKE